MNTYTTVTATGSDVIDPLLFGTRWASQTLTYSFPTALAQLRDYTSVLEDSYFSALTSDQAGVIESALRLWESVANLLFIKAADPAEADIRIYWYTFDNPTARVVDWPGNLPESGDIQLGDAMQPNALDDWSPGTYSYFTLLHELGHALGFKHPHDALNGFPIADPDLDSVMTSVMSYASYPGAIDYAYTIENGSFPTGPMQDDIAALQYLYGPNWQINNGDTTYTFDPTAPVLLLTVWDGGGEDTYNFDSYATDLYIDLQPGGWSELGQQYALLDSSALGYANVNIANPYLFDGDARSLIENATGGAGHDVLVGNLGNNRLQGNAGDDSLYALDGNDFLAGDDGNDGLDGGAGDDTLYGGSGSDLLMGGDGLDTFLFMIGESGIDRIADLSEGERIRLAGLALADTISQGDGTQLLAGHLELFTTDTTTTLHVGVDDLIGGDLSLELDGSFDTSRFAINGDTLELRAAIAPPLPAPMPAPTPSPIIEVRSRVVDGVDVQHLITRNLDGSTTQVITIPVLDNSHLTDPLDLVLASDSSGQPLLSARIPAGFALQVQGHTGTSTDDALSQILAQLNGLISAQDRILLGDALQEQMNVQPDGALLLVHQLTPTLGDDLLPNQPLAITSTTTTPSALLIDARSLPGTTSIELHDAGLVVVAGSSQVSLNGITQLWADSGDQIITLVTDGTTLHAGEGQDRIILTGGSRDAYSLRVTETGLQVQLRDNSAASSSLYDVETLQFGSASMDLTTSEIGSLVRLYGSLLGRLPDQAGLNSWLGAFERGTAMTDIARSFLNASETEHQHGTLDNRALVDLLYRITLNREADPEGQAWHLSFLDNGGDRGQLLLNFVDSAERIMQVGTIDSTIETLS